MIKVLHFTLAFLTVASFVIRAGWSFTAPDLLQQKWVRIAPHVIDTLLLTFGVVLAFSAFNHPTNLIVHQVCPAVAAGAPFIV